jgi:hypothetical protein
MQPATNPSRRKQTVMMPVVVCAALIANARDKFDFRPLKFAKPAGLLRITHGMRSPL